MPLQDARNADDRPSPDALLESAEREARGRLKIFLGAAPGVGKTYEMLLAGRARRADGADVVLGIVETHGRPETEALLDGFEIVPRLRLGYRGRELDEMDLDAIIARPSPARAGRRTRPQQTSRAAGIRSATSTSRNCSTVASTVYTTLNIQHVESLNDVVARITRIRVRETVPDSIIDRGRRHRDHRPDAGRSHQAAARGQGLPGEDRRPRHGQLFLAGQPHRPARAGVETYRPTRRRTARQPYASPRHRRTVGGPATGFWSASTSNPARPPWCATHAGRPIASGRRGRPSTWKPPVR